MASPDHGHLRRKIELGIKVVDGALPLAATHERIVLAEAGRHRGTFQAGHQRVVRGRPALRRHIEARIDRIAEIVEPADAGTQVEYRARTDGEVVAESQALTVGIFRATVCAQARAEGILRQTEQLPISESAEKGLPVGDGLVDPGHIFIGVTARAGALKKIKDGHPCGGRRIGFQFAQKISGGWIDEIAGSPGIGLAERRSTRRSV